MINQPKKPPDLCNYGVITCRKSSWIMDDNIMIQFKVIVWYVTELRISWSEKISVYNIHIQKFFELEKIQFTFKIDLKPSSTSIHFV